MLTYDEALNLNYYKKTSFHILLSPFNKKERPNVLGPLLMLSPVRIPL